MEQNFFEMVYQTVKQIPSGKVATYGQIAKIIGKPKSARQVGFALHANPNPKEIPCHRVVNKCGLLSDNFAFGGIDAQKQLLESEGIIIKNYKVILLNRQWQN